LIEEAARSAYNLAEVFWGKSMTKKEHQRDIARIIKAVEDRDLLLRRGGGVRTRNSKSKQSRKTSSLLNQNGKN
jgi:hypothetical protein